MNINKEIQKMSEDKMQRQMKNWEEEHKMREMKNMPEHMRAKMGRHLLAPRLPKTPPIGK